MRNMMGRKIIIVAGAVLGSMISTGASLAQDSAGLLKVGVASVTYGPYMRAELGSSSPNFNNGHWLPPGYPVDPRVDFDLGGKSAGFAGLAVGFDWMNGFRGDISLLHVGRTDVTGPHTTPGAHTDITAGSVATTAVMGNIFFSPFERMGVNSKLQPFLVAGVGFANNAVGSWSRTNTATTPVVRTFNGHASTSAALSLGVGVSYQLTPVGKPPIMLEIAYRYYHFGTATGGYTADKGASVPTEPLTFHNNAGVISFSVRIPLQRL
ncbi:MAG: hypothetical protein GC186_15140 [Rhodobacteraceae bacterium]|nr:hypothetical protein [Paracoccaceae bacterium]